MSIELINPEGLHPAPGFSHVGIATGSRLVHFAGQLALDPEFNVVGGDDLYEQTVAAMRNAEIAVTAANVRWDQIVRRTVYTTQPTEFETITKGIHAVTGEIPDPPQTIVGITGLAIPGLMIEIELTAVTD